MIVKNYAKSVRDKLLNISRTENLGYQSILTRYFQERLLYRLSQSQYRERFILKGGALLYAYEQLKARPTLDIDFLGKQISRKTNDIKRVFEELCQIPCGEDGVVFDAESVSVEEITLNREYNGVMIRVRVTLGTATQVLSMDIGFGDVIIPEPVDLLYPILIAELPEVNILAYSLETVVAEKFHAMIDHSVENSRMKDFFDTYRLLQSDKLDGIILSEAIQATFKNRGTIVAANHALFSDSFANNESRIAMWNGYLKKIKYADNIPFNIVWECIVQRLKPLVVNSHSESHV